MYISKKELLDITGISYGQLYRWKRERLIPEEWFIKRSSSTGQETFFPREKIMERIHTIQTLKDLYSLEELSKILSPDIRDGISIDLAHADKIKGLNIKVLELYKEIMELKDMKFYDFLVVLLLTKIQKSLDFKESELKKFIKNHSLQLQSCGNTQFVVLLLEINKQYSLFLLKEHMYMDMKKDGLNIYFDENMKIVDTIFLSKLNDEFRKNNKELFMGG